MMEGNETRLNKIADKVLLVGSATSVTLIVLGILLFIPSSHGHFGHMTGQNFYQIFHHAFHFEGAAIVNLGILILMLTPLLRVVTALIGFILLRFWRFAIVSLIVLLILLMSFFLKWF
jgi:uncharacterized membrane protein